MKKSTVLVCGGAGYIGSHTSVELIDAGYEVVIADNFSNSEMAAVEGVRRITGVEVPFVEVDCCDRAAFRKVFEQYEFDSVIHFAASKAVNESVQNPMLYYRNNLTSLMNIIDLMREFGRRNIVFSSSCTVYGEPVMVKSVVDGRVTESFKMSPENEEAFKKEYADLLETEVDIDIRTVRPEAIDLCETSERYNVPSVAQIIGMSFMIEDVEQ